MSTILLVTMNKFIQIYSLILGLSMLDIVTCSNKLKSSLSFLDHTLDEGGLTNCDLAFQGGNIILDEGHDGRAVISGSNGELLPRPDVIAKTKCLILVYDEPTQLTDVINVVSSIQSTKPVGVIFEVLNVDDVSQLLNKTISFPLIFVDAGAKMIFCPTLSKMVKTFRNFPQQGRCPNGKELMRGSEIAMTFAGGGPYLVRKGGKLIAGALLAIVDTLGTKYGFASSMTPGKGVNIVVSTVSKRDFQVGMVVILYNANIARKVQYLPWMYEHEFLMYSLKPQEINNYLTLFNPFGPFLWMCIALTALCLIFVLVITGETTSLMNIEFKDVIMPLSLLWYQGVPDPLNRSPQRKITRNILILLTIFFGFIFGLIYKEKLVSSLVAKDYEKPIDTVQDLLDSGRKMYYPGGTPIARSIVTDPREKIKQVVKTNAEGFPFAGVFPSWVVDRMLNKTGVALFPRAGNKAIVKPEFYNSKDVLFQPLLTMILPKASPLRLPFYDSLTWMQDTGVLQKLVNTGYYSAYGRFSRTRYMKFEEQKSEPLKSKNMYMIYWGLAISAILSLGTFTVEARLWKKCKCGALSCC